MLNADSKCSKPWCLNWTAYTPAPCWASELLFSPPWWRNAASCCELLHPGSTTSLPGHPGRTPPSYCARLSGRGCTSPTKPACKTSPDEETWENMRMLWMLKLVSLWSKLKLHPGAPSNMSVTWPKGLCFNYIWIWRNQSFIRVHTFFPQFKFKHFQGKFLNFGDKNNTNYLKCLFSLLSYLLLLLIILWSYLIFYSRDKIN